VPDRRPSAFWDLFRVTVHDDHPVVLRSAHPADQTAVDGLVAESIADDDKPVCRPKRLLESEVLVGENPCFVTEDLVERANEKEWPQVVRDSKHPAILSPRVQSIAVRDACGHGAAPVLARQPEAPPGERAVELQQPYVAVVEAVAPDAEIAVDPLKPVGEGDTGAFERRFQHEVMVEREELDLVAGPAGVDDGQKVVSARQWPVEENARDVADVVVGVQRNAVDGR